ncbi:MAG: hypothetical protein ACFFDH_17955 [Promethearchaeota archaeon]
MGYKDILVLKEKENRNFLLLIILLLIASILVQFEYHSSLWWRGSELLTIVSDTLLVYFFFSLILKDKMNKYAYIIIPLCWILAYPLSFFLGQTIVGDWISFVLFIFALYYWILITAAFSMNDIYDKSAKWDRKLEGGTNSFKRVLRWILFFGGAAISITLLYFCSTFILDFQYHSLGFKSIILSINFFMILYIVLFLIIGIIALFFHKSYLWFGMFFLFVSVYAIKLMIDLGTYEYAGEVSNPVFGLFSFFFGIYLLLVALGELMGENSEIIANKLKIIKPKILSIWLIYALAQTLYVPESTGDIELWTLGYVYPFFVGIFGIYAIYTYNKKSIVSKESKQFVITSESEKTNIEPKQKKKSKDEKKLLKVRKKLEEKLEFSKYLIKNNKVEIALKNFREIKDDAEKHEFYDLVLKAEESIEYCNKELSKL